MALDRENVTHPLIFMLQRSKKHITFATTREHLAVFWASFCWAPS